MFKNSPVYDSTTNRFECIDLERETPSDDTTGINNNHQGTISDNNESSVIENNTNFSNATKNEPNDCPAASIIKDSNTFYRNYSPPQCKNSSSASSINTSLNFISIQSKIEIFKQANFPEFDPMNTDVVSWIDLFESKITNLDALDQSLSIIVKYLDQFGLEFYRQVISAQPSINWTQFKTKFVECFRNFKLHKINEALWYNYSGDGNVDDYMNEKRRLLKYSLPELNQDTVERITIASIKSDELINEVSNKIINRKVRTRQNDLKINVKSVKRSIEHQSTPKILPTGSCFDNIPLVSVQKQPVHEESFSRNQQDDIVCDWLKRHYKLTTDKTDIVRSIDLFERIHQDLNSLFSKPIPKARVGLMMKKVFGNVPYIRSPNNQNYYGCLKEISIEAQGDCEGMNTIDHQVLEESPVEEQGRSAKVVKWLKTNFERTDNTDDKIERKVLKTELENYLLSQGFAPNSNVRLPFNEAFSDHIPYLRLGASRTAFYGNLKRRVCETYEEPSFEEHLQYDSGEEEVINTVETSVQEPLSRLFGQDVINDTMDQFVRNHYERTQNKDDMVRRDDLHNEVVTFMRTLCKGEINRTSVVRSTRRVFGDLPKVSRRTKDDSKVDPRIYFYGFLRKKSEILNNSQI